MDRTILASFHVTITSAENTSWQGHVEINGTKHEFRSELQLLRCVLEQYPALRPAACWNTAQPRSIAPDKHRQ